MPGRPTNLDHRAGSARLAVGGGGVYLVFMVMGKALSGELSCTQTGIVSLLPIISFSFPLDDGSV